MKLEAGKKYKMRNGEITECIAIWTKEIQGFQATCIREHQGERIYEYALNGRYYSEQEGDFDIVEDYVPTECWINLYVDELNNFYTEIWQTKFAADLADRQLGSHRITCVKVEWEPKKEKP